MPVYRNPDTGEITERQGFVGRQLATIGQAFLPSIVVGEDLVTTQADLARKAKGLIHPRTLDIDTPRTFSGCDISVHVNIAGKIKKFAELQTISYSVYREKFPVRTIGRPNPKSIVRGARTISGSLIFTVFDRHAFWEISKQYPTGDTSVPHTAIPLLDQLPPFDITLTFQNEYGDMSAVRVLGVEIVSEGQIHSVDDLILENTMQYIARDLIPMAPTGDEVPKEVDLGMFLPNSGIFQQSTAEDAYISTIRNIQKQIGVIEKSMATETDTVEFASLKSERTMLLDKLQSLHDTKTIQADRRVINDPRGGSYSMAWNYLDIR
jgi:hypothetical protein